MPCSWVNGEWGMWKAIPEGPHLPLACRCLGVLYASSPAQNNSLERKLPKLPFEVVVCNNFTGHCGHRRGERREAFEDASLLLPLKGSPSSRLTCPVPLSCSLLIQVPFLFLLLACLPLTLLLALDPAITLTLSSLSTSLQNLLCGPRKT